MKILLGMSGGLDSTYAAARLLRDGHTVEGAVLVMHGHTEIEAAEASAESLGIRLHTIDCSSEFEKCVVSDFVDAYRSGKTPNPCVICNSEIKFKRLYEFAMDNGFDMIATGHYANVVRLECDGGVRYAIKRSADAKKDQTYVLWRLSQEILSRLLFPLSDSEKSEVRREAKATGLFAADRADSQEICFIPDGDYAGYIERSTSPSPCGNFVDEDGRVLGEHKGIIRYTVGQRKGLGIALGKRVFVTDIDPVKNTVTLSGEDKVYDRVQVSGMVFSGMNEPKIGSEVDLFVKLRYLASPAPAVLKYLGCGRASVELKVAQRAVTPGQSAVFYDGDLLVAGGFIERKTDR